MSTIARVKTWLVNDTLTAADLNAEFNNIVSDYNGSISNANIAADAAIAITKLATTVVSLTGTQTLTNKTLTTPLLKSFYQDSIGGSYLLTMPAAADTLVGRATTDTLTNKRITPRVVSTTDDTTAVIDVDVTDEYVLTAVATATTFSTTGTPVNGQKLIIRFKDAGVAKGLTWDAVFNVIGVTLPTTTVASKTHYVGCVYNSTSSKWDVLAVAVEA